MKVLFSSRPYLDFIRMDLQKDIAMCLCMYYPREFSWVWKEEPKKPDLLKIKSL